MEHLRRFVRGAVVGALMFALPAWTMGHYVEWPVFPLVFVLLLPLIPLAFLRLGVGLSWSSPFLRGGDQGVKLTFPVQHTYEWIPCTSIELAVLSLLGWSCAVGIVWVLARKEEAPFRWRSPERLPHELARAWRRPRSWLRLSPSLITIGLLLFHSARNEQPFSEPDAFPTPLPGAPNTQVVLQTATVMKTIVGCQMVALEVRRGMDATSAERFYCAEPGKTLSWDTEGWALATIHDGELMMTRPSFASRVPTFPLQLLGHLSQLTPRLIQFPEEKTYAVIRRRVVPDRTVPGDLRCSGTNEALYEAAQNLEQWIARARARSRAWPVPMGLSGQEEVAYRCLRSATYWGIFTMSGFAPSIPGDNLVAFTKLTQSRDSARIFRHLLDEASFTGRLYALAALYRLDRPLFDANIPKDRLPTRSNGLTVCDRIPDWAHKVVSDLESGEATMTMWTRWESEAESGLTAKSFARYQLLYDGLNCVLER